MTYYTGWRMHHLAGARMTRTVMCGQGETLAIGKLPERASYALYREGGGTLTVLAYFRTEEQAMEAGRMLDALAIAAPMEEAE